MTQFVLGHLSRLINTILLITLPHTSENNTICAETLHPIVGLILYYEYAIKCINYTNMALCHKWHCTELHKQ